MQKKQTTLKQQTNAVGLISKGWGEGEEIMQFYGFTVRMKCQFCATSLTQRETEI
jgi:hypothetical protein